MMICSTLHKVIGGTLEELLWRWERDYTSTEADPRGIEADGNMDGLYPDHLRQSDFKVEI